MSKKNRLRGRGSRRRHVARQSRRKRAGRGSDSGLRPHPEKLDKVTEQFPPAR